MAIERNVSILVLPRIFEEKYMNGYDVHEALYLTGKIRDPFLCSRVEPTWSYGENVLNIISTFH